MKPSLMLTRCAVVCLTVISLLGVTSAQVLPPIKVADYKSPVRLACVGDSITRGSGAVTGMSYPSQLQELLGDSWKVTNFGVSGRTLMRSGDFPYWNETAFREAQESDPNVVIIMLGTNDTKPQNWAHKDQFEKDYRDLVKTFQNLPSKPRIYLCRAVPVPEPGNFGINEAGIQEQIVIVDRIAKEMGAGIIDMHAALLPSPQLLPDRVHPNTEGAGVMARTAYQILTETTPPVPTRANRIFSDGAVLQQGVPVPVWGTAADGVKVTVKFAGQTETATAAGGKWRILLKPMAASSDPREMVIGGNTSMTLKNILVGDVWLASGQSNMERQLGPRPGQKELVGWQEAAAAANFPLIREFKVPLKYSKSEAVDTEGTWNVCSPVSVKNFSAVGFYFARDLQPKIKIPVAIIHSSWGGTPVEAWTSPEALTAQKIDCSNISNQNSPSALHQAMIAPLIGFPVKGVIWYQGESNNSNATQYRDRFSAMIADWRKQWGNPQLPFLFVQIAPHKHMTPELREAQLQTLEKAAHTAMVVTADVGDAEDIHPANKEPVGVRLALAARALAYGEKIEYSGPLFESVKPVGNKLVIAFTHVGKGLEARGGALRGVTIAGPDGNFFPATAEIQGREVVVSSAEVPEPKAVRYGWSNVPDVNLFNQDGLPASPFRSDAK